MRLPTSELDLRRFDARRFADAEARVAAGGVEVRSLAALRARFPDWKRRYWKLGGELVADVPSAEAPTWFSFEEFEASLADPAWTADAVFVAAGGEDWVGLSLMRRVLGDPTRMHTAFTGVRRTHRRRGIATALKVAGLRWAQGQGIERVDTDNEEANPMLALNLALGFEERPAWLVFKKEVG